MKKLPERDPVLNCVGPQEMATTETALSPAPWGVGGGNGHMYLSDAKGRRVLGNWHIYIWDKEEDELFDKKLNSINSGVAATVKQIFADIDKIQPPSRRAAFVESVYVNRMFGFGVDRKNEKQPLKEPNLDSSQAKQIAELFAEHGRSDLAEIISGKKLAEKHLKDNKLYDLKRLIEKGFIKATDLGFTDDEWAKKYEAYDHALQIRSAKRILNRLRNEELTARARKNEIGWLKRLKSEGKLHIEEIEITGEEIAMIDASPVIF